MRNSRRFETASEREKIVNKLYKLGYDKDECDKMSYEELYNQLSQEMSEEEIMEEINVRKIFGIKKASEKVDAELGFNEEGELTPSKNLNVFVGQAKRFGLKDDMKFVEGALKKARKVGYGVSWSYEPITLKNLKDMQGSDEEKELVVYIVNRALKSMTVKSKGGHNFGEKPKLESINPKFKHLESFKSFKR